jgi:hypothetical protein
MAQQYCSYGKTFLGDVIVLNVKTTALALIVCGKLLVRINYTGGMQ